MTALAEAPGVMEAMGAEVAEALRDLRQGLLRMSGAAPRLRGALAARIRRQAVELDEATATATHADQQLLLA